MKIPSNISKFIAAGVYSRIVAPSIAGIANKNENFIASSFLIPKINEVEIVEPDLDIPGMIAKPCATPIKIESNVVSFLFP